MPEEFRKATFRLSEKCLITLDDLTSLYAPMVALAFFNVEENTSFPGFNVGIPLAKWRGFQKFVADFKPNVEVN